MRKQSSHSKDEVISPPNKREGTGAEMCPAVVSGIVTGTRCGSAIGRAAGPLLDAPRVSYWTRCGSAIVLDALRVSYWTRCGSAIGHAACQLLDALRVSYWLVFFCLSLVTFREVFA